MILRALMLCTAIAGGLAAAQFPAFSQQYVQRLGGAVDALAQVVADFDASASASGLTRRAALDDMVGTDFLRRRSSDMQRSIDRLDRLSQALAKLEAAGPFTRAYRAAHLSDPEIAWRTLAAFEPGLPLGWAGLVFGGLGFLASLALMGLMRRLRP